jgi:very-short-patch-repair endonuclease
VSDKPTPVSRARQLRRKMTKAEKLIWHKLRNRQWMSLKFLRQHPLVYQVIGNTPRYFVADFYCAEKQLIIEVDGKIHDFQLDEDQRREDILKDLGMKIMRIRNEETEDMNLVLSKIKAFIVKIEMENK